MNRLVSIIVACASVTALLPAGSPARGAEARRIAGRPHHAFSSQISAAPAMAAGQRDAQSAVGRDAQPDAVRADPRRGDRVFILAPDAFLDDFGFDWPGLGWGLPYDPWYGQPVYLSPDYSSGGAYLEAYPYDRTAIELHVSPWSAEVRLDGSEVGRARDFNGWRKALDIAPGKHVLELAAPGFKTLRLRLDPVDRQYYSLHYRLEKGEGLDPRSVTTAGA